MSSIAHLAETLTQLLEEEANQLARESGFVQRQRCLSGADFAQTLIFGWLQDPEETLAGFTQIAERRAVTISASGWCQRFTPTAATFLQKLRERFTQARLAAKAAPVALLKRFSAVIVEDSSYLMVPPEVAAFFGGGAEHAQSGQAQLKLFVRWDVLSGDVRGPLLTPGQQADSHSPFNAQELPAGSLYLAELGFFGLPRLIQCSQRGAGGKRYYLMRLPIDTALYTRRGHRLELRGLLPAEPGASRELGVRLGQQARLPVRLILSRVPEEVAEPRRLRIRQEARERGQEPSERLLYLAGWTIVVSNVPRRRLSLPECLVVLTVRWQIECLFRLWKQEGRIDEWRSRKCWRIVCELCAKLMAMLLQHWLIEVGCWQDPRRSLVKAAQVVRREANRVMVSLWEGNLQPPLAGVLRCMGSGCRVEQRRQYPSTAQRLQGAPVLGRPRPRWPPKRRRDQVRRWPAGKGWDSFKPSRKTQGRVVSLT